MEEKEKKKSLIKKKKSLMATWKDHDLLSSKDEDKEANLYLMHEGNLCRGTWIMDAHSIDNALYVKQLKHNLLSISQLRDSGLISKLKKHNLVVKGLPSLVIAIVIVTEVIDIACYLQNRIYKRLILKKTTYELWKGKQPNISYFHPFRCDCFIFNTKDNMGKFDPKSEKGIFIGYSSMSKAYIVYNSRTMKVEESIHKNDVWKLVSPPNFKSIIGIKWIFINKLDENDDMIFGVIDDSLYKEGQAKDVIYIHQSTYVKEFDAYMRGHAKCFADGVTNAEKALWNKPNSHQAFMILVVNLYNRLSNSMNQRPISLSPVQFLHSSSQSISALGILMTIAKGSSIAIPRNYAIATSSVGRD
ncbi:hypothetical protein CR513_00284, partial [Mucuna pruriens]